MIKNKIALDFGTLILKATLFDTDIARKFSRQLPYEVALTQWGEELYGPIGVNLGEEAPLDDIPAGGLAYTNRGNHICIFMGQTPAWPVEYIGHFDDDRWISLMDNTSCLQLRIGWPA